MVKQLSVFVENKPGRLAKVAKALGEENINIRALAVAELGEFGVIRLIVDDPEKAYNSLKEKNYVVGLNDVLAIEMGDEPGSLAKIASVLGENDVNIEYCYAFVAKSKEKAVLIARVNDMKKAKEVLLKAGIRTIEEDELYKL